MFKRIDAKTINESFEAKYGIFDEVVCESTSGSLNESLEDLKPDEDGNVLNENRNFGQAAWELNEIISHMNNEEAYYGSWLYYWPDGDDLEMAMEDFDDEESIADLREVFERVYKAFHKDGLYNAPEDVVKRAHEYDRKFNLEPIKNYVDEDLQVDIDDADIKCDWCGEEYPQEEMRVSDIGNLCPQCRRAIRSKGEELWLREAICESTNQDEIDLTNYLNKILETESCTDIVNRLSSRLGDAAFYDLLVKCYGDEIAPDENECLNEDAAAEQPTLGVTQGYTGPGRYEIYTYQGSENPTMFKWADFKDENQYNKAAKLIGDKFATAVKISECIHRKEEPLFKYRLAADESLLQDIHEEDERLIKRLGKNGREALDKYMEEFPEANVYFSEKDFKKFLEWCKENDFTLDESVINEKALSLTNSFDGLINTLMGKANSALHTKKDNDTATDTSSDSSSSDNSTGETAEKVSSATKAIDSIKTAAKMIKGS